MSILGFRSKQIGPAFLTFGLAIVILCGGACGSDTQNAAARGQAEQELQQLQADQQELQRLRSENQDLTRLRRDNQELQRLRAQAQELSKLQQENQQLRGQLEALKPSKPRP